MSPQGATATGIATLTSDHTVLDVWYPEPSLGATSSSGHRVLSGDEVPAELAALTGPDTDRGVERVAVRVEISDRSAYAIERGEQARSRRFCESGQLIEYGKAGGHIHPFIRIIR